MDKKFIKKMKETWMCTQEKDREQQAEEGGNNSKVGEVRRKKREKQRNKSENEQGWIRAVRNRSNALCTSGMSFCSNPQKHGGSDHKTRRHSERHREIPELGE